MLFLLEYPPYPPHASASEERVFAGLPESVRSILELLLFFPPPIIEEPLPPATPATLLGPEPLFSPSEGCCCFF